MGGVIGIIPVSYTDYRNKPAVGQRDILNIFHPKMKILL